MNQSVRIRKFAIPTAHHLSEVYLSSTFSTIYTLYTIYANYFHFDGKLLIKYGMNTAKMLASQGYLIGFPGIYTKRLACGWRLLWIYLRRLVNITRGHF